MAMSLAESAKLSQNVLVKGIIEEIVKTSPLVDALPFINVTGNALKINREDSDNAPSVAFHGVNDTWTESTGQFESDTFSLTILGGDADVDNFIQETRGNINDPMAEQVSWQTKMLTHAFEEASVYGDEDSDNEFDGFHEMVNDAVDASITDAYVDAGASALSLMDLDEAYDKCSKAGEPSFYLMSKKMNRVLTAYLRQHGSYVTERDDYGRYFTMWQGIPIFVTDFINDTEQYTSHKLTNDTGGTTTTSVFCVHADPATGVMGIQNGGIRTEVWNKLENKDAARTRIKWYVGMAQKSRFSVVRIHDIDSSSSVTAS